MTKSTFAELATEIHNIRSDRRPRHRRPIPNKARAIAAAFEASGWSKAEYENELAERTARILAETRPTELITQQLTPDYNRFLQLLVADAETNR